MNRITYNLVTIGMLSLSSAWGSDGSQSTFFKRSDVDSLALSVQIDPVDTHKKDFKDKELGWNPKHEMSSNLSRNPLLERFEDFKYTGTEKDSTFKFLDDSPSFRIDWHDNSSLFSRNTILSQFGNLFDSGTEKDTFSLRNDFWKPDPPLLTSDLAFSPSSHKPIKRGGIVLPSLKPGKLGLRDCFKRYGVDIENRFDFHNLFLLDSIPTKASALLNFEDSSLKLKKLFPGVERLSPEQLGLLNDDQIIERFKVLTGFIYSEGESERIQFLKELVRDDRSRSIILTASKISTDHILEAWGNACYFKPKVLKVLLTQKAIVDHLSTLKNEEGEDLLGRSLASAVLLNQDNMIPLYYQIPHVFNLIRYKIQKSDVHYADLSADALKMYFKAGLLMSLSSRAEKDIRKLMHQDVIDFIKEDSDLLSSVVTRMTENRNRPLARVLFEKNDFSIAPEQILDAIKVPAIWGALSQDTQKILFARALEADSKLKLDTLEAEHNLLLASEHVLTSHPRVIEDMQKFVPDLATRYQELQSKELGEDIDHGTHLELLAQKHKIEKEFIDCLTELTAGKELSTPWLNAEAGFAFERKIFGQGVKVLVTELDVIPELHKDRLLKTHLGTKTFYEKKAKGRRSDHNTGVTSLVSRMSPMAKIVSTSTREIDRLEQDIQNGEFPFINCSWGPANALTEDKEVSIFSSVKVLNNLLGKETAVLVKSAGNEGLSLSNPDLEGDPSGIFFSKLLKRLKPEEMNNVILAVNLTQGNAVSDTSNTLGYDQMIFQNALSTQGSSTYWLDETGNEYFPLKDGGTSSAAPIITGAGALLKSYKPNLSPIEIKKCLLHSAIRDFEVQDEKGNVMKWIYESEPMNDKINPVQFNFAEYGMGILNMRSAFKYADILDVHLSDQQSQKVEAPMTFEEYEGLRNGLKIELGGTHAHKPAVFDKLIEEGF